MTLKRKAGCEFSERRSRVSCKRAAIALRVANEKVSRKAAKFAKGSKQALFFLATWRLGVILIKEAQRAQPA
jgi:hypothetical protein